MAALGQRFNAQDHDTDKQGGSFEKPPEGIYKLEVSESSVDEKGNGTQARFKMTIVAPEAYKDQWIFYNAWVQHSNVTAQEIGQRDLARLCRAVEVPEPNDTDELHFKPFVAELRNGKPYQAKKDGIPQTNDDGSPLMRTNLEVKKFFYPDEGTPPDLAIFGEPANDNVPQQQRAANDNNPPPAQQQAATGTTARRPWKK